MKRYKKNNYRLKGVERAIKLKDLEIAKSFEISQSKKEELQQERISDSKISTPNIRSELSKE